MTRHRTGLDSRTGGQQQRRGVYLEQNAEWSTFTPRLLQINKFNRACQDQRTWIYRWVMEKALESLLESDSEMSSSKDALLWDQQLGDLTTKMTQKKKVVGEEEGKGGDNHLF